MPYDNLWEWKNDIKKIFNIDYKDIDEIAVVIDPWRNKLPVDNEEFYPAISMNIYLYQTKSTE